MSRPSPIHRFVADMMSSQVTVDTTIAQEDLGNAPTTVLDEGIWGMVAEA